MRNYACAVEPAFARRAPAYIIRLRKNACKEEIFRENSFRDYSSQYLGTLTCIKRRIGLLEGNSMFLRSRKHLQSKYVLVPADKAANNFIVEYY